MKIIYFFLLIFSINIYSDTMKIYDPFFINLHKSNFRAEFITYKIFKKKPILKNINFLCMPWAKLQENSNRNKKFNLSDVQNLNLKINGGFTVCSHDNYEPVLPLLKKIGITTLFVTSATTRKYKGIEVVAIPYTTRNGTKPSLNKNIFYSFVGGPTHPVRGKIFQMKHAVNSVIIKRDTFHFRHDKSVIKKYEEEYRDVLSRSRFSLCPRGGGSNSYRFWESLEAGAIPVLISDECLLPPGYDWSKCVIRVKENDIQKIPYILSKISKEKEKEMFKNCLIAYKLHSGKNIVKVIRDYYR